MVIDYYIGVKSCFNMFLSFY